MKTSSPSISLIMADRARDWSQLNPDLLQLIAGTLIHIIDHIRFRAVCRSWRSAARSIPSPRHIPWLLLLPPPRRIRDEEDRHVISPSEQWRTYTLRPPNSLRLIRGTTTFGSSGGYVVVVHNHNQRISIANPLVADTTIPLPPLPIVGDLRVLNAKVFYSNDSILCVIVCCYGNPYLWNFGDTGWTQFYMDSRCVADFALYKGSFYCVEHDGVTVALDTSTLSKTSQISGPSIPTEHYNVRYYLVESSSGELLLLAQDIRYMVWIFRLDFSEQQSKWVKVNSIGDDAIFLDRCNAICFPAGRFNWGKTNCVYFISFLEDSFVAKLFNIEDDSVELFSVREDGSAECVPCKPWTRWEVGFVPSLS